MYEATLITITAIGIIVVGCLVSSYWNLFIRYKRLEFRYKKLDMYNDFLQRRCEELFPIRDKKGRFVKRTK